jgi:ethanolamine utilization microcompartment shell protein EutL
MIHAADEARTRELIMTAPRSTMRDTCGGRGANKIKVGAAVHGLLSGSGVHEGARCDSAGPHEDERSSVITWTNINKCTLYNIQMVSRCSAQSTVEHTHPQGIELQMQDVRLAVRFTHAVLVDEGRWFRV